MSNKDTNTSQWSLVIHRVTSTSVEVWVGTLFPTLKKPDIARIELIHPDGSKQTRRITKEQWQQPFRKLNQRFFKVIKFTNLAPGKNYELNFIRRIEANGSVIQQAWQHLRSGAFTTLPNRIPLKGKKPFTIALGSCFYNHRDGGRAAAAYKALYQRGSDNVRPDITFLTGDQVYLDIGFDSLSLVRDEIRQRIADDYALHWQAMGSILCNGGTWMLPDDHEFWNDYPFYKSAIPQLQALRLGYVRKTWDTAATDAVNNIQRSKPFETFNIGRDLSICLTDLRSFRDESGFTSTSVFNKIKKWAHELRSPGVFVTSQPLIVEENDSEKNLLSYKQQYAELLQAFSVSGHDIVLMSGDVHFGRIATTQLGNEAKGPRLIEIVASPMSNLTYLNGIATDKAKSTPIKFPAPEVCKLNNWKPVKVTYNKLFQVSTKKGNIFSAYPRTRTREHFMTISFSRNTTSGTIDLSANAWRIRETKGPKMLPVKDFDRTFTFKLK
ncbi:hypothetical protein MNBD_GAMMA17-1378 [hydrothermal vent metagenome]|uniref:PhoD-like phosphatase metallophosphatase domain-containing protein n=1 Tax=hydrothermal vent metagenome TaxID=652676 RepID=A0A3B0Z4P9_9ZZZZ